jgi:hypothetical protein
MPRRVAALDERGRRGQRPRLQIDAGMRLAMIGEKSVEADIRPERPSAFTPCGARL